MGSLNNRDLGWTRLHLRRVCAAPLGRESRHRALQTGSFLEIKNCVSICLEHHLDFGEACSLPPLLYLLNPDVHRSPLFRHPNLMSCHPRSGLAHNNTELFSRMQAPYGNGFGSRWWPPGQNTVPRSTTPRSGTQSWQALAWSYPAPPHVSQTG